MRPLRQVVCAAKAFDHEPGFSRLHQLGVPTELEISVIGACLVFPSHGQRRIQPGGPVVDRQRSDRDAFFSCGGFLKG